MRVGARIFTTAVGAVASACILAVPTVDPGEAHCRFAGIESDCGRCMAGRCAAAIDTCCADDTCGGVVSDVEACASKAKDACTRLADPADRGGVHAELSTCVATECASVCQLVELPSTRNDTRCERAYVTSLETCECEIGPTPNDMECTEVGHPFLRCCAPEGWPAPVRSCECLRIICVSAGAGCLCQLSAMDDNNRGTECTGQTCCYDPLSNNCACNTVPCRPEETQVPSCTIDALGCDEGRHRVETCTVAKP